MMWNLVSLLMHIQEECNENKAFFSSYLVSIVRKINDITGIQNNIFSNCTSKDPLQSHSANNSCDRKTTFHCRSECIKLNVPDNKLDINSWYQILTSSKGNCWQLFYSSDMNETRLLFDKERMIYYLSVTDPIRKGGGNTTLTRITNTNIAIMVDIVSKPADQSG